MKLLQNKETGEIGCLVCSFEKYEKMRVVEYIDFKRWGKVWYYNSLAELNEKWEDYKNQQEYYIDEQGGIKTCGAIEDDIPDEMLSEMKQIGNYFKTREEAEKAVEKLKAWKRLKENGFKFNEWSLLNGISFELSDNFYDSNDLLVRDFRDDLDLLFGGEE